jgi:exodeoxyribonuclease VII small subunit
MSTNAAPDPLSYEAAMQELERVVGKLEKGELSLEDSLTAYERGVAMVRAARTSLQSMEHRLSQLTSRGDTAPLAGPAKP